MNFHHYILTRYNIRLYTENDYKIERADAWMDDRFPLFRATAESIRAQHNQTFTWLIIVDPDTTARQLALIQNELPDNAEIVYSTRFDLADLAATYTWQGEWIMTTRLDNDDLLHPNFVDTVHRVASPHDHIIDTLGWVLWEDGTRTKPRWDGRPVSMFMTMVEPNIKGVRPRTVAYRPHSHLHRHHPSVLIEERLWTIVIHGNNVNNHLNS